MQGRKQCIKYATFVNRKKNNNDIYLYLLAYV